MSHFETCCFGILAQPIPPGQLFAQSMGYDAAGNVSSSVMTQAVVPGQTGSGGSETQNFCYDEQNRLVWAGNSTHSRYRF